MRRINITQKDIMDLEQLTPFSEETGLSVDLTVDMDLLSISVTVDECLGENVSKKAVSIGHSHATESDFRVTRSIHFTLNVQKHLVNPDQNFPMYKVSLVSL